MKCPACSRELKSQETGGITVDVCAGGCGGIWFDNLELQKVDEESEAAGIALLNVPKDPKLTVDQAQKRHCPVCPDIFLMKHFFDAKMRVQVDQCANCGGYWLDQGELASIRGDFKSTADRKNFDQEFLHNMTKNELEDLQNQAEASLKRAQKIANMLRFICPSYYIPGKQKGGAF